MLRICAAEGCETKTLGALCIAHESVSWRPQLPPGARSRRSVARLTSKVELGERGWATDARAHVFH